jgi:uncharacterized protein YdhG (YjbR/CyaY superfamily)
LKENYQFKTVDEYIEAQSKEMKEALLSVRKCILKIVPSAEELINYNILAFSLIKNGKRDQQIMLAVYKGHIGFYPHPTTIYAFEKELKEYKTGKGSVQFPLNKPIPFELIERMVQYRLKLL